MTFGFVLVGTSPKVVGIHYSVHVDNGCKFERKAVQYKDRANRLILAPVVCGYGQAESTSRETSEKNIYPQEYVDCLVAMGRYVQYIALVQAQDK